MDIRKRQLDFVYHQLFYGQIASFVCSVFVIILLWRSPIYSWVIGWFSILTILSVSRVISAYFYHKQKSITPAYSLYKTIYIAGAFAGGMTWGASTLFLGYVSDVTLQFGIVLIIAGITAGSISSNAIILAGFNAFLIPVLAMLSIWLLSQQSPNHSTLAIITVFYAAMLIILAKKYRDHLLMAYEAQDKNQQLIEELSSTNHELNNEVYIRQLAESALKKSELRFRNIVEAAPDAMVLTDEAGDIIMVNQEAVHLFGYTEQELMGQKIESLVPDRFPQHADIRKKYIQETRVGKLDLNPALFAKHKNGHEIPVEIRLSAVPVDKGKYISSSIRDISKHIQIEDELRLARNQAEKANSAKSDFISNINHELRTPLNAVIGFSQLLQLADNMSTKQADQLVEINQAGKHLLKLIDEMQDISRIESGRVEIHYEAVKISDILHDCLAFTKPLSAKKNILPEIIDSEYIDAYVNADKTRFKQVILNILSNAIKYNTDNGNITIHCHLADYDKLKLSITDTGPGFSSAQLKNLYQPYNRLGAEKSNIEGTGIGLALSKKLLELMGGKITLETRLGVGSTFLVELPQAYPKNKSLTKTG